MRDPLPLGTSWDSKLSHSEHRGLGDGRRDSNGRREPPSHKEVDGRGYQLERPARQPSPSRAIPEPPRHHRHSSRDRDRSRRRHSRPSVARRASSKTTRRSRSRSAHRRPAEQPLPRQRHSPADVRVGSGAGERESRGVDKHGGGHQDKRREISKIRELVERLYIQHNPSKLADLDGLFDKYHGMERQMYLRICTLYKVEPDPYLAGTAEARSSPRRASKSRSADRPKPMKPVAKSAALRGSGGTRIMDAPPVARTDDAEARRLQEGGSHQVVRRPSNASRSPRPSPVANSRPPDHSLKYAAPHADTLQPQLAEGKVEEVVDQWETAYPDAPVCSSPDCGMQLCAGINFATHPVSKQMFCYDCWFTGGMYLEVEAGSGSRARRRDVAEDPKAKTGRPRSPAAGDARASRRSSRPRTTTEGPSEARPGASSSAALGASAARSPRGTGSREAAAPPDRGADSRRQSGSRAFNSTGGAVNGELDGAAAAPDRVRRGGKLEGAASKLPGERPEASGGPRHHRSHSSSPVRSER